MDFSHIKGINKIDKNWLTIFKSFFNMMQRNSGKWSAAQISSVALRHDKSNGLYLRIDFGPGDWLHLNKYGFYY